MVNPEIALAIFFCSLAVLFLGHKLKIWSTLFSNREQARKALIEDVLKQLFHVEYSGRSAGLNDMAGALEIVDNKLVEIIESMTLGNLIESSRNIIQLTPAGRDYALKIIRVHRLWEKYLSEKTGIHKSEWHDRAELKEHTLTSEQAEELYQELGSPRYDPLGNPIPTESGELIYTNWKPLSSLNSGTRATILHIEDEPEVIYQRIITKNLHVGSQLRIIESSEHQIEFYCEGNVYKLSPIVASNINVKELKKEDSFEESHVRLTALNNGENANIVGISSECRGVNRRRLLDLGFIKGTPIKIEYPGPMKNPKAYLIKNTLIALRNDQAELILIEKE
ncbi:MAG: DtxR family transcriptional regulator [Cytophagales bacterium]|nr:DtxR family transcriptional regulator [Cytophagales bacterium]